MIPPAPINILWWLQSEHNSYALECLSAKINNKIWIKQVNYSTKHPLGRRFKNFPSDLIAIIMDCISSSTVSILFNGGKLDSYSPSRGIRQGDLISPYIFILCLRVPWATHSWKDISQDLETYQSLKIWSCLFPSILRGWSYPFWSSLSSYCWSNWRGSHSFLPSIWPKSQQWEMQDSFLKKHPRGNKGLYLQLSWLFRD